MTAEVTIITPTLPGRERLLNRAIESVDAQTYADYNHLIITDGPWMVGIEQTRRREERNFKRRGGWVGYWGRLAALAEIDSPYVAYLDDDNWWHPNHLELLMAAVKKAAQPLSTVRPWMAFAFGQADYNGEPLSDGRPVVGKVDVSALVHHISCMDISTFRPEDGYCAEGKMVERWVSAGIPWKFVPETTMVYTGPRDGRAEDIPDDKTLEKVGR